LHPEHADSLKAHGFKLRALAEGALSPSTDAQRKFVRVASGKVPASSDWELLWLRFCALEALRLNSEGSDFGNLECPADLTRLAEHVAKKNIGRDCALAVYLAERARDLGDHHASYLLGILFEYGLGAPQDRQKAREHYRAAYNYGVPVEESKLYLHDIDAQTVNGNGCRITAPADNNLVSRREIDDYDAKDWESHY